MEYQGGACRLLNRNVIITVKCKRLVVAKQKIQDAGRRGINRARGSKRGKG